MSIHDVIHEFSEIQKELENIKKRKRILESRFGDLQNIIRSYLEEKNLPGVKYNGIVIYLKNINKKVFKPAKERKPIILETLKEIGVQDPEKAYQIMIDKQKIEKQSNKLILK